MEPDLSSGSTRCSGKNANGSKGNKGSSSAKRSGAGGGEKAKSKSKNPIVPSDDTEAVAILRPIWQSAAADLQRAAASSSETVKVLEILQNLTSSLEDAEDASEAVYLLAKPLPDTVSIVLDTPFMVDTLHKKATEFMQASLNFCLGAVAMDAPAFAVGAFNLMNQIFRHRHFLEVMSIAAPAPVAAASANALAGAPQAGPKQPTSFADVVKTPSSAATPGTGAGRSVLTASRTAKTLNRLTEAVTLFTRQDGYKIIISTLEHPQIKDLSIIAQILDAVTAMNQYIGVGFLRQHMPLLLKAVFAKMLKFIPFKDDKARELFVSIRDLMLTEAAQHGQGDPSLTAITQSFVLDYTSKMLKTTGESMLSILFVVFATRAKQYLEVDIKAMKSVRELKEHLAKTISVTRVLPSQLAIATISQGTIVKVHPDNAHIFSLLCDSHESIVAYEIPHARGSASTPATASSSSDTSVLLQVSQTKPLDRHFVPFFLLPRGEKQLNAQWLYESVGGAYIFSSNSTSNIFNLRLIPQNTTSSPMDLSISSNKPLNSLAVATAETLNTLSPAAVLEVEWNDGVTFEELLGYKPSQYYEAERATEWKLSEFKRFALGTKESLATFLCDVPAAPADAFKSAQRFVSALAETACIAVDKVSLRIAARILNELARNGNSVMKFTIMKQVAPVLISRFTALLEVPNDRELHAALSSALCEFSSIVSASTPGATQLDLYPFSRASGLVDGHDAASGSSLASVPLCGSLQFLFKLNLYRTIDVSYIATADPKAELFWYLPLILKMIKQEPSNTPRSAVVALMQTLQKRQFLAQLAMWLRITRFVNDDDFPGGIDWASSKRFENSRELFRQIGQSMPEQGKVWSDLEILDPIYENDDGSNRVITKMTVKKIFTSKAKPCLLEVVYKEKSLKTSELAESTSDSDSKKQRRDKKQKKQQQDQSAPAGPATGLFIFKKGDDLRVDMLVQTMFFMFNTIWSNAGLKHVPFCYQYKIIPMGADIGAVEFVNKSESIQTFDWNSWKTLTQEQKLKFICSAAGGYVAGWVLGIRDRHQDNMMVREGHIFFQIDFGHMFNEKPTIDAPRFAIPSDMKTVMTPEEWELFKDVVADAFRALYRVSNVVISLCLSLYDGVEDVDIPKVRKFMTSEQGLMVSMSEADACARIKSMVESGVSSLWRMNKWGIHTMFAAGGAKTPPPAIPPTSPAPSK